MVKIYFALGNKDCMADYSLAAGGAAVVNFKKNNENKNSNTIYNDLIKALKLVLTSFPMIG